MKTNTSLRATRALKAISFLLISFPVVYLLLSIVTFDIPASKIVPILLSPSFYFVSFWVVLAGYGLWEMQRWGWYVFLFASVLIVYENASIVSTYSESHHKGLAFLAALGMLGAIFYRVAREMRVPYLFPRIRWWETSYALQAVIPAKVRKESGTFEGVILDLSPAGCFIKTHEPFEEESEVVVEFMMEETPMGCSGVVVWQAQSAVTHPKGIGVKFGIQSRQNRRKLRVFSSRLRKRAKK